MAENSESALDRIAEALEEISGTLEAIAMSTDRHLLPTLEKLVQRVTYLGLGEADGGDGAMLIVAQEVKDLRLAIEQS